jgi:hypothetical protein
LRGPSAKLGLLLALCALSSEHMASSVTPGGPAARELVLATSTQRLSLASRYLFSALA